MTTHSIIELLKQDHRDVAKLFEQATHTTERAAAKRTALWDKIVLALEIHMAFEEAKIYPVLHAQSKTRDEALEAEAEHQQAKRLFAIGSAISVTDERWKANVTVLAEDITHHVHEEESPDGLFAHLRKALDAEKLVELGAEYVAMKERAMKDHAVPAGHG